MNKTPIQWTWAQNQDGTLIPMSGSTWNPLLGCKEVSAGCAGCYAARLIGTRFAKNPKLPMYHDIATVGANGHPHFTGARRMMADRLDEPLRARKGRKVFVCDMGDLFYEGHPFEDIAAVFGVMAASPQHTFQVLTKRPERAVEFFAWVESKSIGMLTRDTWPNMTIALAAMAALGQQRIWTVPSEQPWPLPNVWIGTSVEDQPAADKRIPRLLRVPTVVRFLSMEPLLGPVDLTDVCIEAIGVVDHIDALHCDVDPEDDQFGGATIDWLIIGGESGPKARPHDLAWARSIIAQADEAGVPVFMKQLGARPYDSQKGVEVFPGEARALAQSHPHHLCSAGLTVQLRDSHGGDETEWPADLRGRRAFPRPA